MSALIILQAVSIMTIIGYIAYDDNLRRRYKRLKRDYEKVIAENRIYDKYFGDNRRR